MKTVVVTGASSGIGLAVCNQLLKQGFRLIAVGRCSENCEKANEFLLKENPQADLIFLYADMINQSEVRRLSREICGYLDEKCDGKLFAFISNAGCVRSWYSTSEDGYEQQLALNHLAPFLLTYYLIPYLIKAEGRILVTSSNSHKMMKMRWKDIMFQKRYDPLKVYKQSKLCNMLFVYAINKRFSSKGIHAYGIDPGLVATDIGSKQTGGLVRLIWSIRKRSGEAPEIPAKTYIWLCDQDPAPRELYYYNCKKRNHSKEVTQANSDKLFGLSEQLCGIDYDELLRLSSNN